MTFTQLIEKFSNEYNVTVVSHGADAELSDVAFLDCRSNSYLGNTLYFGYDRQVKSLTSLPPYCILARTDHNISTFPIGNYIVFTEESMLFSLFNDIKDLIQSTSSRGIFEELTGLADKTHSIDAVIDAAAIKLGNSLLFCDMNFKITASSSSIPILDPMWSEAIKEEHCSYEFINNIQKSKALRNASLTTAACDVTCPNSPYRKLMSKVFYNQTPVGFLLMIEGENPIIPSHFEMLCTISHVISYTIAYYTPSFFKENGIYHEFLHDMLAGISLNEIGIRLDKLHFPPRMQVLFILPTKYLGPQYLDNFTYKNLKIRIPGTCATYYKKGIVAVIPVKEGKEEEFELQTILKDFYQNEHIRIGISNPFTNIESLLSYFDQAYAALKLGQRLKSEEMVHYYQDFQFFDLLSDVRHPDKLGRYCHPALSILRQYDLKNSSELYKTLCVFIDKGCNIKLTSESLYIHRNSLVYRLNRITELCRLDFDDANTAFLLRLSFLIDRYNELNTSKDWNE
ncbi:PucR family transcriptional regulator [Konateibacter massiliensis]|uniref:PucR family transcriptional regulator n=1 Tax=Konateibacter massiliensis TaxID=2002841 RepID=UPI000C14BC6A|nr:helix-turn-helix domain-containing protein [Konateibacter massiliensis]